jgi:hypothetical protein
VAAGGGPGAVGGGPARLTRRDALCPPRSGGRGSPLQRRSRAFDPPTSRLADARRQGPSPSLRLGDKPPRLCPPRSGGRGVAAPTPLAGSDLPPACGWGTNHLGFVPHVVAEGGSPSNAARRQGPSPSLWLGDKPPRLCPPRSGGRGVAPPTPLAGRDLPPACGWGTNHLGFVPHVVGVGGLPLQAARGLSVPLPPGSLTLAGRDLPPACGWGTNHLGFVPHVVGEGAPAAGGGGVGGPPLQHRSSDTLEKVQRPPLGGAEHPEPGSGGVGDAAKNARHGGRCGSHSTCQ